MLPNFSDSQNLHCVHSPESDAAIGFRQDTTQDREAMLYELASSTLGQDISNTLSSPHPHPKNSTCLSSLSIQERSETIVNSCDEIRHLLKHLYESTLGTGQIISEAERVFDLCATAHLRAQLRDVTHLLLKHQQELITNYHTLYSDLNNIYQSARLISQEAMKNGTHHDALTSAQEQSHMEKY